MRFRRLPRSAAPLRLERSIVFERFEGSERSRRAADWRRVRAQLRKLEPQERAHVFARWARVPLEYAEPIRLWIIIETRHPELLESVGARQM